MVGGSIVAIALLAACKGKPAPGDAALAVVRPPPRDGGVADARPNKDPWPALAALPKIEPVRVVSLAINKDAAPGDSVGPVVAGGLAVVASPQLGFVAVDYRRGQVAWHKPAGGRTAPPLARPDGFVLLGDCVGDVGVPAGERGVGCLRAVTRAGGDEGYVAVHGKRLEAFAHATGAEATWSLGEHAIAWRRGDQALSIEPVTGEATPISAADPPIVVRYRDRTWEVTRDAAGVITGREHAGTSWHTRRGYSELLGAIYLPEQGPMIRAANLHHFAGAPELNLFDIDATGSMHGQVSFPVPGVALFGHAIDAVGDTALALRLDTSLEHDYIVGFAANALIMYVYPLPIAQRQQPIGLAVANDAVVAFHDGDTLTILPELSAPPTAPGAARPPSENSTP